MRGIGYALTAVLMGLGILLFWVPFVGTGLFIAGAVVGYITEVCS